MSARLLRQKKSRSSTTDVHQLYKVVCAYFVVSGIFVRSFVILTAETNRNMCYCHTLLCYKWLVIAGASTVFHMEKIYFFSTKIHLSGIIYHS